MKYLIVLLLLAATVQATIFVKDIECSETGYVSFTAEYTCSKDKCSPNPQKPWSQVSITAESIDKNYSVMIDEPPVFLDINEKRLVSKEGILDPYKSYTLVLDDGEETKRYDFKCANVKYLCEKIDLEIDLCMEHELDYYYLFHGLGMQFSAAELRDDIVYYINPANTYFGTVALTSDELGKGPIKSEDIPETYEVRHIGLDRYLLRVPSRDLKNQVMDKLYLEVEGCDKSRYASAAFIRCKEKQCFEDSHCPIGAYCENSTCRILRCSLCESIQQHKCISTCQPRTVCEKASCRGDECYYTFIENCCLSSSGCDDSDVCTTDICSGNRCTHKNITCDDSEDECVIGVCDPAEGCKYISNPECAQADPEPFLMQQPMIIMARLLILAAFIGIAWFTFKKNK